MHVYSSPGGRAVLCVLPRAGSRFCASCRAQAGRGGAGGAGRPSGGPGVAADGVGEEGGGEASPCMERAGGRCGRWWRGERPSRDLLERSCETSALASQCVTAERASTGVCVSACTMPGCLGSRSSQELFAHLEREQPVHTVVHSTRGQFCVGAAAVRCMPGMQANAPGLHPRRRQRTGTWFRAPRSAALATPLARAAPVAKSALSGAHSA